MKPRLGEPKIHFVTVSRFPDEAFHKTLDSMTGQVLKPDLWLIVSPFSPSWDEVKLPEYSQLIHDPGLGVYFAMNTYLSINLDEQAFVIFLNAGDFFSSKNSVSLISNYLEKTNLDLIFTRIHLCDSKGLILNHSFPRVLSTTRHLRGGSPIPHSGVILRACLFHKVGGFNVQYLISADIDLFFRVSMLSQPEVADFQFSSFLLGGLSSTSRKLSQIELFKIRNSYRAIGPFPFFQSLYDLLIGLVRGAFIDLLTKLGLANNFRKLYHRYLKG